MTALRENKEMRVLAALGMIFIAAGHIELDAFTFWGIFPYYSFHVYIFLFIAGYFYDPDAEKKSIAYILKKLRNLIVPYFVWNLFYGLVSTFLNTRGFSLGQDISLYSYFAEPFMGGHQYMLNAPSWFMISLFFVEMVNLATGKLLSYLKLMNEWLLFILYLAAGIVTVFLSKGGHVWGAYKDVGRVLIMLYGFGLGRIFKVKLEKYFVGIKRLSGIPLMLAYASAFFLIQFALSRMCAGLSFSTVWVTGFANSAIVPFITVTTGVMFYFSLSRILVLVLEKLKGKGTKLLEIICAIGRESKAIMLHHIFIVFLINCLLYFFYMNGAGFGSFDVSSFLSDVYYVYGRGLFDGPKWIYLILCVMIPVLFSILGKKIKNKMKRPGITASILTVFLAAALFAGGCAKKDNTLDIKTAVRASEVVSEVINGAQVADNPDDFLSVPTYITRLDGLYFIVDCYHNRVIYSDDVTSPLYTWKVMTDSINMGHTIASDGTVYLVDDTENNRILVFEKGTGAEDIPSFTLTQQFDDIGKRPHYIVYDEKTDTFYAWSSLTGQMYLLRRDKTDNRMYLTQIKSIPELDGFYVRSFTIIGDKIYFVSGNCNIIEAKLESFEITKRYPVPDDIAGMVQLTKIQDYYYITVSTDIMADQDAATLIRVKDLELLKTGEYEDIYSLFVGGGTPYCITMIDDTYYLCEHRIPGHSIWSFRVQNNELTDIQTLF